MLFNAVSSAVSALALSSFVSNVAATPVHETKTMEIVTKRAPRPDITELQPVSHNVPALRGLTRRDDPVGVDLVSADSWYWGKDPNHPNANLTAYAGGDNDRVLSMEKFSSQLKSTSCSADGKSVAFTFKSQPLMNAAKNSFGWVNQGGRSILLVTNAPNCGDNPRQPFKATGVSFNGNTATFKTEKVTWEEGLHTFNLHFSSAGIGNAQELEKQEKEKRELERRFLGISLPIPNIDKNIPIGVGHDFSGQIFSKQLSDSVSAELDCNNCATRGTLNFDVNIGGNTDTPKVELSLTPSGVGASVTLDFKLSAQLTDAISDTFPLVDHLALPGGFSIPAIGSIGPSLNVVAVVGITEVTAEVDLSFGVDMSIPDSSLARIDLFDSTQNAFNGFNPTFTPIGPTLDGSVSVSGSVGPRIDLAIDVEAFGKGAAAGLSLSAPEVTMDLSANAASEGGVCGDPNAQLGVNFDVGLAAELDAFGGVGNVNDLPNKKAILSTSTQLFSTCVTIAGSAPTDSSSSSTTDSSGSSSTATTIDAGTITPAPAAPVQTISFTSFSDTNCGQNLDASVINTNTPISVPADGSCQPVNAGGAGGLDSVQFTDLPDCTIRFFPDNTCGGSAGPSAELGLLASFNGSICLQDTDFSDGANNNVNFATFLCGGQ
ncbi:hypothetical protein NA57DRAFT_54063 [Rhizodiscina lignyota]|uniref:Uncharacterized protein n=1 Tax=Rhizodiscina lignyota TaxID=1504668 RepID=A0A9P4IQ14_9PEZI|nr:hypothetical protein NA57DRAFT_54063 [Rhizodiscina lignyota]